MRDAKRRSYLLGLIGVGLVVAYVAGTGCGDFRFPWQGQESCEDCVARCVKTQGVSPEICRGRACSSICPQQ